MAEEISQPGNITLTHKNYTYDKDATAITISEANKVIDGNGAVIDMAGSTIRAFHVSGPGVTIKNLTIKNANYNGNGGAIYFDSTGTVTNCNFVNNSARYGGAIRFSSTGTVTNCNFTDNTVSSQGGAVHVGSGTVSNCNFADNKATIRDGGAVFFIHQGTVTKCNFTNNSARSAGAVFFMDGGDVANCNFTCNTASINGGAVYFTDSGTVTNCNFTGNNATNGSAIYFYNWDSSNTLTVSDSTFLNNRANAGALDIVKTENNITITFTGQNNLLNAIYYREDAEVTFNNVKYWGSNGITTVSSTMSGSNKATGQNITVGVVVNGKIVLNQVYVTDEEGTIVLNINAGDNYYITARHDTDSYYTEAEKTISNNTKFNVNVTSQTTTNKTVNITAKSNIYSEIMPGKLLLYLTRWH